MTADEDDDYLLRYLNRVSLQVITLLDFDGHERAWLQARPTKTATDTLQAPAKTKTSGCKPSSAPKQTLAQSKGAEGRPTAQPTRKKPRATRVQQQRRETKRSKSQQQQQLHRQADDANELAKQTNSLFANQFELINEEKALEQQQQLSSCVLGHDQGHDHFMPYDHHQHQPQAASTDPGTESIIQLDASNHLSPVSLLTLTMPEDSLHRGHLHHHLNGNNNNIHHHHQLDSSQSTGSSANGCNGSTNGNELLTPPGTIHLAPMDQFNGGLSALQSTYYATSSSAYDDFVGQQIHLNHQQQQHHQQQNGTSAAVATSTAAATTPTTASNSAAATAASQTARQNYHANDALGQQQQSLTDCYANQHLAHLDQQQQQGNLATVHHHYQFDHRTNGLANQHEQRQQQWQLSQPLVNCSGSPIQAALDHNQHLHGHQQAIEQHDINYHPAQAAYQQQHYSADQVAGADRAAHVVEHHHHEPICGHLHHVHEHQQQQQQHSHHHHHHQGHHEHENSLHDNHHHNQHLSHQQHMNPHHLQMGPPPPPHHHLHNHHNHLMPPLGPLVNGIECSSVILHDINLASASWSSPEDLYSI